MKKTKVVVSDFHLGKGHILPDGSLNTFEEFYYDEKFIEFLEYYAAGEFADADVEVVNQRRLL